MQQRNNAGDNRCVNKWIHRSLHVHQIEIRFLRSIILYHTSLNCILDKSPEFEGYDMRPDVCHLRNRETCAENPAHGFENLHIH